MVKRDSSAPCRRSPALPHARRLRACMRAFCMPRAVSQRRSCMLLVLVRVVWCSHASPESKLASSSPACACVCVRMTAAHSPRGRKLDLGTAAAAPGAEGTRAEEQLKDAVVWMSIYM